MSRPIGGHREACGAWPGFETTRRAKLAARTASGRAGLAVAGDLAGAAEAGYLASYGKYWKTNGGTDVKKPATRRPPVVCASWGT